MDMGTEMEVRKVLHGAEPQGKRAGRLTDCTTTLSPHTLTANV